ncbi:MAG: hypothetical protein LBP79_01405 [Clostridiales bacterium]|jgi:electron transfer flavoprotein alpha/beta subunit|nr:hypothetical protein [Clostridiales bacterium]
MDDKGGTLKKRFARKIAVCFKVVPDFVQALAEDWENFSENTDLAYVKRVINCFDESALEIALRIKDGGGKIGAPVFCIALTAADALKTSFSRTLFAAGFDRVEVLTDGAELSGYTGGLRTYGFRDNAASAGGADLQEGDGLRTDTELSGNCGVNIAASGVGDNAVSGGAGSDFAANGGASRFGFDSMRTAEKLAERLREIAPDLILTGRQAGCADSGAVPFYIAEFLGLPLFEASTAAFSGGVFLVETDVGAKIEVSAPCVVSVGNGGAEGLRISTLKEVLATAEKTPEILRAAKYFAAANNPKIKFAYFKKEKKCAVMTVGGLTDLLKSGDF